MKWIATLMLLVGLWMAWTGPRKLDLQRAQESTEREVALLLKRHEASRTMTTAMRKAKGFERTQRIASGGYSKPSGLPTRELIFREPLPPPPPSSDQWTLTPMEKKLMDEIRLSHSTDSILVVWCAEVSSVTSLVQSALRKSAGEEFEGLTLIVLADRPSEDSLRVAAAGSGIEVVSATHY